MSIPTPKQVGATLEDSDPYRRPLIALAAFACLRFGEASAVKVEDINI